MVDRSARLLTEGALAAGPQPGNPPGVPPGRPPGRPPGKPYLGWQKAHFGKTNLVSQQSPVPRTITSPQNNHQSPEQSPVLSTITSPQQSLPKQPWPARRLIWSMHMPWPSEGRRSPRKIRVAITSIHIIINTNDDQ